MPSVKYDLNFLQIGLVDLEGYLISKELYWPVMAATPAGEPPYPRMTLGALLLAQARLQARSLPAEQQAQFDQLKTRLEHAKNQWRVAWEQKAVREYQSRLTLWRNFLEDYREEPDANTDRYEYEVQRRVMLELLGEEAGSLPAESLELLRGLDGLLQAVFVSGPFIWDAELQAGFPSSPYWYLYGRPKEGK